MHSVDVFDPVDVYTLKATTGVTGQLYASLSAEINAVTFLPREA